MLLYIYINIYIIIYIINIIIRKHLVAILKGEKWKKERIRNKRKKVNECARKKYREGENYTQKKNTHTRRHTEILRARNDSLLNFLY